MRQAVRMFRHAGFAAVAALAVSGCTEGHEKQEFGTLIGAGIGGLLGSVIDDDGAGGAAAITLGAVAGAAIGSSIGESLDRADRIALAQARQTALEDSPSYQSSEWYNPDSGNRGSITPRPAYQNAQGQYCREYRQTIIVAGREEEGYGTACRQPDGSWKIVSG